ncbi:LytR/AlgR family response regulator transcription factor [Aureispira anguillae]|uniref:LytTR family DNA-binding domain-containing protein n=1 Tax=Aureispira anguillae TaxID=2864201 RepID=A0A915YFI7_9BACT|nr:LytTR family DNA-binding domain-containing protein [Aureispira anguillae]BDS12061.1 LytTR family DNA-binding domain-containing protein [Aureispira anguillae]
MKNIQAVIIDDEPMSVGVLQALLEELASDIELLGTAATIEDGISLIERVQPALVFLDIHLKNGYGFDILKKVNYTNFQVIFITAYHNYAVKAFQFSALHYLLKPINDDDLEEAINRYRQQKKPSLSPKSTHQVLKNAMSGKYKKLGLPTTNSVQYVDVEMISYCEASAGYTTFLLTNKEKIMVSKPLSSYENMLSEVGFFRIHDKYLVNLREVNRYIRGRGGQIELNSGVVLDVAVRKKNTFLSTLDDFFNHR